MRRCAFLTMLDPTGFVIDDDLALPPLRALGWQVDAVPWNQLDVRWRDYELVVVRSPWDYHHQPDAFLSAVAQIERQGPRLENGLQLMRWNYSKTYLRQLEQRGIPIVPTLWRDGLGPGELGPLFDQLQAEEVVLKPVVSASADGAYWLDGRSVREQAAEVEACYAQRPLMAQPFVRAIVDEGEYSLFYFNGEYSHTILKTPKPDDFRVQEEHGGIIQAVPADSALREAGARTMAALNEVPLYGRADFVRSDGGPYWLMELELIEPALYLRMDAGAAERFARAIDARMA